MLEIKAIANVDHAYVIWRPNPLETPDRCLGFALYRKYDGKAAEILDTFVGPTTEQKIPAGTHRPSTTWPIQKYTWSDYLVSGEAPVRYRVVAMLGDDFDHLTEGEASDWSDPVTLEVDPSAVVQPLFNRGVVSTQWVARQLMQAKGKSLKSLVAVPEGRTTGVRDFLGGHLKTFLLKLLDDQQKAGSHIYASLFELNDPEVLPALAAYGQRGHVILSDGTHAKPKGSNGTSKKTTSKTATNGPVDENAAARSRLHAAHLEVQDRMVTGNHFSHHKFIVFTDPNDTTKPIMVWTGSTNLTYGGVCTQANNGILVRDENVAMRFFAQWKQLVQAGDGYPKALVDFDATPVTQEVAPGRITAWFAPNPSLGAKPKTGYGDHPDLKAARALINGAQEGILFLIFNPGPKGTLLNDILALLDNQTKTNTLYIRGVANQDPGGKQPILFVHDNQTQRGEDSIVLPGAVAAPKALGQKDKAAADALAGWVRLVNDYWQEEPTGLGMVRVHSKTIVVDPFGKHPAVITGSHNLGPKASAANDDNLVIIENDPATATAYAVNIITIYDQYRWRFQQMQAAKRHQKVNQWHGLEAPWDTDGGYLKSKTQELKFWL
jgi:phosphatidylserine/phosphatidylglycerophosphate/cardiolipin synthase-like enzyme